MLDTLAKIYNEGGPLVGVAYVLFDGNAHFITKIGLRFGSISAVFRAVQADDTLAVSLGPLVPDRDETSVDVGHSDPWSSCLGSAIRWAWQLTNQQGYQDGVRLEFGDPHMGSNCVIELIVAASAIQIFVAAPKY
jgi:hypothetical protein